MGAYIGSNITKISYLLSMKEDTLSAGPQTDDPALRISLFIWSKGDNWHVSSQFTH